MLGELTPFNHLTSFSKWKLNLKRMLLANQMISLIGSLQPDPLDPRHSEPAPPPAVLHPIQSTNELEEEGEEEEEEERLPTPPPAKKRKKDRKSKDKPASRHSDDDLPDLPKLRLQS